MLPRQFRLSKKEFELVRRQGSLRSGRLMGMLFYFPLPAHSGLRPSGSKTSRFPLPAKAGIIVSKKLSAKATERNRLKRRLRAALARVLPELSDVHVVVLPTKRAMGATVKELQEELVGLLDL